MRPLPRRTMRLRLTLLYATLFLLSGAGLLTITYILVDHATGVSLSTMPPAADADTPPPASGGAPGPRQADQLHALATQQQAQAMHQLLVQSGIALAIMTVVSGGLAGSSPVESCDRCAP